MNDDASDIGDLRQKLCAASPIIRAIFEHLAPALIPGRSASSPGKTVDNTAGKTVNDPVWKTITLTGIEVRVLDTPLMQRLRRVRQLGLASLVYPSAQHSRLEHSLGARHVADRMFMALASDRVSLNPNHREDLRRAVRLAALLHDCGHPAFSHVGEHALARHAAFRKAIEDAHTLLHERFKDRVAESIALDIGGRENSGQGSKKAIPPAAEIISALIVLSEAMERFLEPLGVTATDRLRIAALILGRPYRLGAPDSSYFADFVKSVVSGDLDADKLDYVARDAYCAGIPIATDVDRLISQLTVVEYGVNLEGRQHGRCLLFGVLHAGVAAVEMFVMSRAYLIRRLYHHPKVRVAEEMLKRALSDEIGHRVAGREHDEDAWRDVLSLLYGMNGDDGCLEHLDQSRGGEALALQWRRPRRALALSEATTVGYDATSGRASPLLLKAWNPVGDVLRNDPRPIESEIAALCMVDPKNVIVDWGRSLPIKDHLAVFVDDRFTRGQLRPVSKAFDAGQFAMAYDHTKNLSWVFVENADCATAAAATSIVLGARFGLVPNEAAAIEAKNDPANIKNELKRLCDKYGDHMNGYHADVVLRAWDDKLSIPPTLLQRLFPFNEDEAKKLAMDIAEVFSEANLTGAQLPQFGACAKVMELLVQFAVDGPQTEPRHTLTLVEKDFQKEVHAWLRKAVRNTDISIVGQAPAETGRLDLAVKIGSNRDRHVVVELKSDEGTFEAMVNKHKFQVFSYLTDPKYERIGILFCRFRSHSTRRQNELIRIEFGEDGRTTAVICIGQHIPPASASKIHAVVPTPTA